MYHQSLHAFTKTDLQTINAIHNVTASIQHMSDEDIKNIDKRTYFITIPTSHKNEANRLKNPIYTKIRKTFGFKDQEVKLGMIYCGDVEGTRSSLNKDLNWNYPHIHATAFLPKSIAPKSSIEEQNMIEAMENQLRCLNEIEEQFQRGRNVKIQRYDPNIKSVFEMASYGYKADAKLTDQHAETFTTWTFPYDGKTNDNAVLDTSSERMQNLIFDLHLYPERVFAHPRFDRMTDFQKHYRCLYDEAETDIGRNRVKSRFLRMIS